MMKKPKSQMVHWSARMAATTETICTTILNLPRSLASMVKPAEAAMERNPETRNSRRLYHPGPAFSGYRECLDRGGHYRTGVPGFRFALHRRFRRLHH